MRNAPSGASTRAASASGSRPSASARGANTSDTDHLGKVADVLAAAPAWVDVDSRVAAAEAGKAAEALGVGGIRAEAEAVRRALVAEATHRPGAPAPQLVTRQCQGRARAQSRNLDVRPFDPTLR